MTSEKKRNNLILERARQHGYNGDDPQDAEAHLIMNLDPDRQEECEVESGGHNQRVLWHDGDGYTYECWGEIISPSTYQTTPIGDKIHHSTVIDSAAKIVSLYEVR